MKKMEDKIHEGDWDNLIVLDAARFDFFETFFDCYPNLEHGELEKVKSPGSATPEVLPELFPGRYDWTVFSANPFLNDRGVEAGDSKWISDEHFTDIREIWSSRSTEDTGVVTPTAMAEEIVSQDWDGNMIAWFIQPHIPHIGTISTSMAKSIPDHFVQDGKVDRTLAKLIRESYKYNLLRVLFRVSDLAGMLEGKTVITADHGELLFDDDLDPDCYRHPQNSGHDKLRNVPWLEVDSDRALTHSTLDQEDFVRLAYKSVLKREVGEEGLDNYVSSLETNMSRQDLIETLIHSEEYSENIGDPDGICDIQP